MYRPLGLAILLILSSAACSYGQFEDMEYDSTIKRLLEDPRLQQRLEELIKSFESEGQLSEEEEESDDLIKDDMTNSFVDAVAAIASQNLVDNNLDVYSVPSNYFLGVTSEGTISGYTVLLRNGDAARNVIGTQVVLTPNIDIVSIAANFSWTSNFNNVPESGYAECVGNPITFNSSWAGYYNDSLTSTILSPTSTQVINVGLIEVVVYGVKNDTDPLIPFLQTYFSDLVQVFVPFIVDNNIKAAIQNTLVNDPYPLI